MFYVLLSLALFLFALGLRNSILARKSEKWGCLQEVFSVLLYFSAIGFVGIALLKFPEMRLPLPDFSVILSTSPTTETTSAPTTEPTTVPVETTLPPLTFPPITEPPTEPTEPPTTAPLEPGWYQGIDGNTYYVDDDGSRHIGWLKLNGETFYFDESGKMVRGEVKIDGKTYHFASRGQRIILVNPWNTVPEDYQPDLVNLTTHYGVEGTKVDRSCYDALIKMIDDCNAACPRAAVVSGYRSFDYQTKLFDKKVKKLMDTGVSEEEAKQLAATVVAPPGTSEHQLGLAVDMIDTKLWALEEEQEDLPAQKWLMENSWKYGFVLRYPADKSEVTGIIYEPWHYRYVGTEIAKELYIAGITLEEYIAYLTQ